eukprot:1751379-Amphidinium_carterae.1
MPEVDSQIQMQCKLPFLDVIILLQEKRIASYFAMGRFYDYLDVPSIQVQVALFSEKEASQQYQSLTETNNFNNCPNKRKGGCPGFETLP